LLPLPLDAPQTVALPVRIAPEQAARLTALPKVAVLREPQDESVFSRGLLPTGLPAWPLETQPEARSAGLPQVLLELALVQRVSPPEGSLPPLREPQAWPPRVQPPPEGEEPRQQASSAPLLPPLPSLLFLPWQQPRRPLPPRPALESVCAPSPQHQRG